MIDPGLLFPILLVILVILFIISIRKLLRPDAALKGVIIGGDSKEYGYKIGKVYTYDSEAFGMQIDLTARVPNILVESHRNDSGLQSAAFAANHAQRFELEGDFYKNFAVFAPKGQERIAVQILSPDVMDILQQEAQDFDMELYGRTLNFYSKEDPRKNASTMQTLVQVADAILPQLEPFIARWQTEATDEQINQFLAGRSDKMFKIGRRDINIQFIMTTLIVVTWVLVMAYRILAQ